MKTALLFGLIAIGFLGGLYAGGWLLFVGGIVQIVEGIKATPVDSYGIAVGAFRILLAAPVGWFIFLFTTFIAKEIAK